MSGRIYVPLADVAAAAGMSTYVLQTRFLPADWAVPRDFRLLPPHYTCLVAEASLPAMIAELRAGGLEAEARRVEEWCASIATEESTDEFLARHAATPTAPANAWWQKGQYA
jgi:hypothetical protein